MAAIVTLAGLDIVGAALARHWADHRSAISMIGGIGVFALVFVVYGKSLDYAQLNTVTVGWVALLQAGVIVLDRIHGHAVPTRKLVVIMAIVALEVYLVAFDG
jgi:hypothetical protein